MLGENDLYFGLKGFQRRKQFTYFSDFIQWKMLLRKRRRRNQTLFAAVGLRFISIQALWYWLRLTGSVLCSSSIKQWDVSIRCLVVNQSCYCGDTRASGGCMCMCIHVLLFKHGYFSALCCSACHLYMNTTHCFVVLFSRYIDISCNYFPKVLKLECNFPEWMQE